MGSASEFGAVRQGGVAFTTASTTFFYMLPNCGLPLNLGTTENLTQYGIYAAGTLALMGVRISANARANTTTYGTRINTVNGAIVVSVGSTATGHFQDAVNTDAIASGDKVNGRVTSGTGTSSQTFISCEIKFTPTTGSLQPLSHNCRNNNDITTTSNSAQVGVWPIVGTIAGSGQFNTSEGADTDIIMRSPGTLSHFQTFVSANTRLNGVTAGSRKSTTNQNQTVSIGTGTGFFVDAVNTDAVLNGDIWKYTCATQIETTKSISIAFFGMNFASTGTGFIIGTSVCPSNGSNISTSAVNFYPCMGQLQASTTEGNVQQVCVNTFTADKLRARLTFNGATAVTYAVSINSIAGTQAVSVTGTGLFEDTTNTDSLHVNDTISFRHTTPSGAQNWGQMAMRLDPGGGGGGGGASTRHRFNTIILG